MFSWAISTRVINDLDILRDGRIPSPDILDPFGVFTLSAHAREGYSSHFVCLCVTF